MRNFFQSNGAAQIRTVLQQRRDLAVVATLMFLQSEDGEDLMLSECLRAAGMGIRGQRILRNQMSDQQHLPWRFRGLVHSAACSERETLALPNKVRTRKVFYGAGPVQIIRYSNRLEIRNPGHSLVPDDRLGQPGSLPRNEKIAAAMHEIGLAETK